MDLKEFIDRYNALTGLFLKKLTEEAQDRNIVFSPILDRRENLNTANAVFIRERYKDSILSGSRKRFSEIYDGMIFYSLNLREAVKDRSLEAAHEMLPFLKEIVRQNSLLAMINTVFFRAMWQYPYEVTQIGEGIFHNADQTDSRVVMLYDGGNSFVENDLATGFVKDFQQCGYSFMALLPKAKGRDALHAVTDSADFSGLMGRRQRVILHSKMPEFKLSFRAELIEMMKSLGIRKAFDPGEADLSSMASIPLAADRMVHQAKIEIDRNGARASAATALVCIGACLPKEEKHVMIDRPFVFAIMNREQEIPVFVGVVNHIDPIDQ